jgi:hypothetical protein
MESGKMRWVDRNLLESIVADSEAHAALVAMAPKLLEELEEIAQKPAKPIPEDALRYVLGDMG